jgi:predicted Co/Zn/Cd cation transporter (cation efflux family)
LPERRALAASIAATAALGALGIGWGVATGSQMVLFDGVYGFVGILPSWLMLLASAVAAHGPTRRYPYGREAATPLVIGIHAAVMLATLLYGASEAAYTIRGGGSDVVPGHVIPYGVLAAATSIGTWAWLRRVAGASDLVAAEATAWRVGAVRGGGIAVGFVVAALLEGSRGDDLAPYVDPAMVLLTCAVLLPTPIAMIRANVVELLEGAPAPAVEGPVLSAAAEVARDFGLGEPDVRVAKVGGKLYVEVAVAAPATLTVVDQHRIRTRLREHLAASPYDVWLTVELVPVEATGGPTDPGEAPRSTRSG